MTQKFEYTVLDMIESASRTVKTIPLNLGGVAGTAGGVGGPPGGYIGWLPQTRVAYDYDELASSGTPSSGMSLLDNLNHIRYRLGIVESGGVAGTIIVQDWDGNPTVDPTSRIIFSGATVLDLGGGDVLVIVGSGGSAGSAPFALVSNNYTDVAIADSTSTNLTIDTELYNDDNLVTLVGDKIYVNQEGWYDFEAIAAVSTVGTPLPGNGHITLFLQNNGIFDNTNDYHATISGEILSFHDFISRGSVYLASGEYLQVGVENQTGMSVQAYLHEVLLRPARSATGDTITVSGGGGIDETAADALYLRLDATNDPVTSQLDIVNSTPGDGGIYVVTEGDSFTADFEQFNSTDGFSSSPVIFGFRRISNNKTSTAYMLNLQESRLTGGTFSGGAIRFISNGTERFLYTHNALTNGIVLMVDSDNVISSTGKLASLSNQGTEKFYVTGAGLAYGSEGKLIAEAPIDGTTYGRKDGAWVVSSGGGGGGSGVMLTVGEYDGSPMISNVDTILFSGLVVTNLGSGDVLVSSQSGVQSCIDQSGGTSDTYGVLSGTINGSNKVFTVSHSTYLTGTLEVFINGVLQTQGTAEDWAETSPAAGTFTFVTAPIVGDNITAKYKIYSGSMEFAVISSGIVHVYNEDHTSQIPTTLFTSVHAYASGTMRVYYNGLRQRKNYHYSELSSTTYSTMFPTYSGDIIVVDYDYIG